MKRIGFKMKINTGMQQEYRRRHDNIWPELAEVLKDAGVSDYSIYLDPETGVLFACLKVSDSDAFEKLPENSVLQKWWDYMADIMEVNSDNSPAVKDLKEMFYLDPSSTVASFF